jgi:addiction module HigA family antidote
MPRPPIHPGEILAEELDAAGVSATELARQIDVPPNRVTQIVKGQRGISGDTALRLGHWFGVSAQFWLNLQCAYDIRVAEMAAGRDIARLPTRKGATRAPALKPKSGASTGLKAATQSRPARRGIDKARGLA